MRKLFVCVLLIFSFLPFLLTAQNLEEDKNEQFETFTWQPVAKANQYGVEIEREDPESGEWLSYKSIKTKDTKLEVLLTPGNYRVSIATYNLLGRKGKSTEWVTFKILEESVPYLNEKFFPKNSRWNAPVLFLDRNKNAQSDNLKAEDFIQPAEGYGENTFLIKGRNIFSPKTEFYLVPKEQAEADEKGYVNYSDKRSEQKLEILYRDSSVFSVVLSYEPELLYSGYYALEVRNPGNNKDYIDLLVLDNSPLSLEPDKGFEIDRRYNVNSIILSKNSDENTYNCSVKGKGFNSNTQFYLESTNGALPYPFESQIESSSVSMTVSDYSVLTASAASDSTSLVNLSFETEELRTGYYNLIARNWDDSIVKFICLVKRPFDNDYTDQVKTLKTKYNKRKEIVDITLSDALFDINKTYTLVSQYNEEMDSNYKIPLKLSQNKNKLTGTLLPGDLTIAKYALLIEDAYSSSVIYCDIDNRLKLSMEKMSDSTVDKTFFRPVDADARISLDADQEASVLFYDNRIFMKKTMPPLFSNIRLDLTFDKDMQIILDTELDLLNFGFASLTANYRYLASGSQGQHGLAGILRLGIPNPYFGAYLGLGIGEILKMPGKKLSNFNDFASIFTNKAQAYALAQFGVYIFTVLDIRYNLELKNLFAKDKRYFTDSLSFGFTFPIRSYKFQRNVLTRSATIKKDDYLDGSEVIPPSANVDEITINNAKRIAGFEAFEKLEDLSLDTNVEVIEENAFRDCKNLTRVNFYSLYTAGNPLVISQGAFAGDSQIDSIWLPARTLEVKNGAFDGWTNGQLIILAWPSNDTKVRNLAGLENCGATVLYNDGSVFKGNYNNPLEDSRNWVPLNTLELSNVSIYKDKVYSLGINLQGIGEKWFRTELYSWINQDSPQEALDYIKSGDKITFKVEGDGNKYDFILTSQDGGYFYYRFKTEKGKVTTVEIPYKKLKKYSYSNVKKFDKDNIKMFCIMPMCRNEMNNVSFFDFEVSSK